MIRDKGVLRFAILKKKGDNQKNLMESEHSEEKMIHEF